VTEGRIDHYVLDARGDPVPEPDALEWERWRKQADRSVLRTVVPAGPGVEVEVSTVFAGLDHASDGGPPLLYETMIFGGPHHGLCWYHPDLESARAGHRDAVAMVIGPDRETR